MAEEYSYNSTFAFAENKLGLGMEYEGLEMAPFHLGNTVWKSAGFSHVPDQGENEAMVKKAAINTAKVTAQVVGTAILAEVGMALMAPLLEGTMLGEIIGVGVEAKNISKAASTLEKSAASELKATSEVISTTESSTPSLKEQAQTIKNTINGGKNSITIKRNDGHTRYDLDGKAHAGVETPHSQSYKNNIVNGEVKSVSRESKNATPMTQQEIRLIRKYIEKL